ncbi:hypothetical protein GCM10007925_09480 [Sphingomonas astaxanthinifaciens DSM 22298]|uniref:Uncharacterized protein n=1 Tax=Sphingomonas astaxanthinifaciens DSM 22298 TaxID=1123267 RepID=A0ABQ5Z5F6_9SPHN|nr:hypothetical protein GCM10007925_09480 [Sphingomonas astaxanthinifaciens DSM 22298]
MLDELPLHDATFDGILLKDKNAKLHFTTVKGARREVRLSGVDALHLSDFREGNIVVFTGVSSKEVPQHGVDWERLYPSPHPSAAESYHNDWRAHLSSKQEALRSGNLMLLQVVPAHGADLLATCRTVTFV